MTKVRKQKRKKRFRANVNRKRLRNKLQKLPKIDCKEIENEWELKKSIRSNLNEMGLTYDPNEVLQIRSIKQDLIGVIRRDKIITENNVQEVDEEESMNQINLFKRKIHVANDLENEAKAPRERLFRLPKNQVQFITYMMEKYGDDYKAMARDKKNYYQLTWCQIRGKIDKFKSIPEQYAEYLLKTGEIVLDDPTPLEETKKRIGEENAMKYSVAKKQKVTKKRKPLWEVESIGDDDETDEFHIGNKNLSDDTNNANSIHSENGLKKLKLFSDDESDAEHAPDEKNKKTSAKLKNANRNIKQLDLNEKNIPVDHKLNSNSRNYSNLVEENQTEDSANKRRKSNLVLQKCDSSDSDNDDEEASLDGDNPADGFVNLSDMSEVELSEDDILDDGEFLTDSNDESD